MNLTFLGTGAADFGAELETVYRDAFSKDIRRSSALLVNGTILIDCGPHTLHAMEIAGRPQAAVAHLLITHTHDDHFCPADIAALSWAAGGRLHVYGSPAAMAALPAEIDPAHRHPMQFGDMNVLDGVTVTALDANHLGDFPDEQPLHYLLESDGRKVLYATDGAWMCNRTAKRLAHAGLDLWIADCTVGDYTGDLRTFEHNSMPMLRMMEAGLRTRGTLRPDSRILLTHLARTLHPSHDETVRIAAGYGYEVAYDGAQFDLPAADD